MGIGKSVRHVQADEAADLLTGSHITNVVEEGGMKATTIRTEEGEAVLIQGMSDTYLLVH